MDAGGLSHQPAAQGRCQSWLVSAYLLLALVWRVDLLFRGAWPQAEYLATGECSISIVSTSETFGSTSVPVIPTGLSNVARTAMETRARPGGVSPGGTSI